jgi:hypothetical protein
MYSGESVRSGSISEDNPSEPSLMLGFIYSGDFAERVIRNLINDPSYCKPCGLYCDSCKYNVYTCVRNIRAAIELPSLSELPSFIDDPGKYIPKTIPKSDLWVASGLHKDLLLELPRHIKRAEAKGLIVPVEDPAEVPMGLRTQLNDECERLGLESAFPKPFCSLEPFEDKPIISRFVTELKIGRPSLNITTVATGDSEFIQSTEVRRSAPCGSTWYVAKKLLGVEVKTDVIHDAVAKAHHSYPCTAAMTVDPEEKEPILHIAGYIIREEVENGLKQGRAVALGKNAGRHSRQLKQSQGK